MEREAPNKPKGCGKAEPLGGLRLFTDLVTWQKAREVRRSISALVKGFPADEKFRLTDQMIRSSRGPTANIAEGYGRFHAKDNARFCRMASGSLIETMDHLTTALDEGYIDGKEFKAQWERAAEALRVLHGYIRYLRSIDPSASQAADPKFPYGEVDDFPTPLNM